MNNINEYLENKGKIVFQLAKEMKKVHILKFMCNQITYWDFDKAFNRPKVFLRPEGKYYPLRKAAGFLFNIKDKTKLKKEILNTIQIWEQYYNNHHGCLGNYQQL